MKVFVIGNNAVGKNEVLSDLRQLGFKIGKRFASVEGLPGEYYLEGYQYLDTSEVIKLFEAKSYIFLKENNVFDKSFYEGLSTYTYNNNDVFALSFDQFLDIPKIEKDVVLVWMDGTVQNRRTRHISSRRKYNFIKMDDYERKLGKNFVEKLYQYDNVLYFNNEDPSRVSAIVASLLKYPDLIKIYKTRFY